MTDKETRQSDTINGSLPPVKLILIGCGAVSQQYYLPALKELEKLNLLRVQALYDPNAENIAFLQQAFPNAESLPALSSLRQSKADLAIIASPPRYHCEQTIQALEAGMAVLCEKPLALSVQEGKKMVDAARRSSQLLAVGLCRRFFPATETIRQILTAELLGEIKSFYCYEGGIFRWPLQSATFFKKEDAGGGVLFDIGAHLLDLLVWWWGQPAEVLYEDDAMGGMEANCRIEITFPDGFNGEVRLSRDWDLPNRYFIEGSKGWLSWDVNDADHLQLGIANTDFALQSELHKIKSRTALTTPGVPAFNFQQSFIAQIRNIVAAIHGNTELIAPGEQALDSLRLIEECYRNRRLMHMSWLEETEALRASQLNEASS